MNATERAKAFSNERLAKIRSGLEGIVPSHAVVVTCGSYARREASAASDLDFFIISDGQNGTEPEASSAEWMAAARDQIAQVVQTEPAADGAFAQVESRAAMSHNIGGENDSNQKITRRMLFLLEGEWLANPDGLHVVRHQILERYIGVAMTDHQLALFLLNDIIRYYRTIAVDFEFKTVEGGKPKPWGIRNIKLVFSRKLLYASGLFSVAMTADRQRDEKIKILEHLFDLPVIERLKEICGPDKIHDVLNSYEAFLSKLEDQDVRNRLKNITREQRDDPLFRELKNEGHHLSRELLKLYDATFDSTHPIRRAVIF